MAEFRPNIADQVVINAVLHLAAVRVRDEKDEAMVIDMLRSALPHCHVEHRHIGPLAEAARLFLEAHDRDPSQRPPTECLLLDRAAADVARWRLFEAWARFEDVKGRAA